MNLSFSATCDGSVAATTTANTVVTVIGSSDRVTFLVPAALATGTYYIWITGTYASSNCSGYGHAYLQHVGSLPAL